MAVPSFLWQMSNLTALLTNSNTIIGTIPTEIGLLTNLGKDNVLLLLVVVVVVVVMMNSAMSTFVGWDLPVVCVLCLLLYSLSLPLSPNDHVARPYRSPYRIDFHGIQQ